MVMVLVEEPAPLLAVSVTVYVPAAFQVELGFSSVDVAGSPPSNSQEKSVAFSAGLVGEVHS
ncbi:MAG: hypothetical protein R2792_11250 [Saprospiraceae bacterium]